MSAPRTSRTLQPTARTSLRHHHSHARLLRDVSHAAAQPGRTRRGRPDAIIVPAARPASALTRAITLAASLECEIVVLCSHQANPDQVAERISRVPGAHGLVLDLDRHYLFPVPGLETSSPTFAAVSGGRASDLSLKRNVGLILARLMGWRKILFVDDDITLSPADVARIAEQLDDHQIAGMVCRDFPDNSVFCHARRLAELEQDVFVTGAALGVNCSDLPLPFFPDIYNEDWFFFAEAAAHHRLAKVGEARQAPYNPYTRPERAEHEEFGDLLAEGLYALIERQHLSISTRRRGGFVEQIAKLATEAYWTNYIEVRSRDLQRTRVQLQEFLAGDNCSDDVNAAVTSLTRADARYDKYQKDPITAARCAEFVEAWRGDAATWSMSYPHTRITGSLRDAMAWLDPTSWQRV